MRNNLCQPATSNQPLISIITVVLNGAVTLEGAIKSVTGQKFQDFEYIIVDGGSTDGSIEIIERYQSKLAAWISERDKGLYDAMNKGISLSNGKWIYFLGSDDYLLDGWEKASSYLKDEKTLYYGDVYRPVVDRIYDGKFSPYKLACRNICHQSIFYPRCVWDKYSYDLKYPVSADYDLNLRCFADPGIRFQYIPVTIAVFVDEGGLSPTRVDDAFERDKLSILKSIFPLWIYTLISFRRFSLDILSRLRLQKTLTSIYHWLLRIQPTQSKEKKRYQKSGKTGNDKID